MGYLATLSTVAAPSRMQALTSAQYNQAFFSGEPVPDNWLGSGYLVDRDLALSLSYVYSAVDIISSDLGTMTCQMFETTADGGREKVHPSRGAIGAGDLAYKLRWQPNSWQTSKAYWSTLAWQYLLRPQCFAEIVYRPGRNFVDQLIPRHPDRVKQEVLPNGRLSYVIREPNGTSRRVTQDEMFTVRNTSHDGLNALCRIDYGAPSIAVGLTLQQYTGAYFKKGASAALLATYKGEQDPLNEEDLHASITRFMGPENAGGVLLVPEDIAVTALGVDPEKAQLTDLRNLSGRDIARLFKMPPSWLGIEGAQSYNSLIQDSQLYVNRVLMPLVVEFEQAIQRDLILNEGRYFAKFNLDYLLRGDFLQRMQGYEIAIRSRVLRPSEARVREDYNPDERLDELSEGDNQPGQPAQSQPPAGKTGAQPGNDNSRAQFKGLLALHDNAERALRREREHVEKLAKKHANDPDGWKAGLASFYGDFARYVAEAMRIPMISAQMYCQAHQEQFVTQGVKAFEDWEVWRRAEADELVMIAIGNREEAA